MYSFINVRVPFRRSKQKKTGALVGRTSSAKTEQKWEKTKREMYGYVITLCAFIDEWKKKSSCKKIVEGNTTRW